MVGESGISDGMSILADNDPGAHGPVRTVIEGAAARIVLSRPERRNALSHEMLEGVIAALDAMHADRSIRVVVLAADGPAFSSGHDLREVQSAPAERIEALFALCARMMLRMREIPQPVIARVHGVATAAGCQMVAACDLAIAAEGATFATPGVNIGLFCSTPAVPIVRSIGRKRAMEMLLTGDAIDARTALDWGLVNRVVPLDALDEAVDALAARIASVSADTVALGKRAFYAQLERDEHDAYAIASQAMCENMSLPDASEGIAAFLEKRPASWRR